MPGDAKAEELGRNRTLRRSTGLLLGALLVAACDPGEQVAAGGHRRTFRFDGTVRSYTVYLPARYDTAESVPLVVDMHGAGGTGEGQRAASGFWELHDDPEDGFAIVYPDGVRNLWNAGGTCGACVQSRSVDDVGFLVEMTRRILEEWPRIDAGRVYATGFSNGSAMTQRLGIEASDVFAAGAGYAAPLLAAAPEERRPFPVIHFAGYQDTVVPHGGDGHFPSTDANEATWTALQGCAVTPRIEALSPPGSPRAPNRCAHHDGCAGGVEVVSCSLAADHLVYRNPGHIDVTRMGWEFMRRFRR